MPKPLPSKLYAQASVTSSGGLSLFDVKPGSIKSSNAEAFHASAQRRAAAVRKLRAAGFEVLQVAPASLAIAGPPRLYETYFRTGLFTEERAVMAMLNQPDTRTFIEADNHPMPSLISTGSSPVASLVAGVAIAQPPEYFELPYAPTRAYWHLRVPGDVSLGLNADRVHRKGITGRGVKVVMVDTGWYRHPYFVARGYNCGPVVLGPGASLPDADEVGHGTAESANIFAIAPDVSFQLVKAGVDAVGAFNAAVALRPHIISCSWGYSIETGPLSAYQNVLAAAIATAVAQGIIVVFSAGNGHWGFPGQHPDVLAAGGVYLDEKGQLQASNYASGFKSRIYPNRTVPDVCGLVGMLPRAAYIMLPVQPKDEIDTELAGGTFPDADETTATDGWAAISGTSAAAPQLAGVCALLKQKRKTLLPAQARELLKSTAIDVRAGQASASTGGNAAGPGPDPATGAGLADAFAAFGKL